MTDREAAKQALEAYDKHEPLAVVMEELRIALKQPEQEQHQPWCDSVTKLLTSYPPQIPPCNCKQEAAA